MGAHDAVLDNRNGRIVALGGGRYLLNIDISTAAGVQGNTGVYLWTVALVQVSPSYADLGQQAEPALVRFESPNIDSGGTGGIGVD